MVVKKDWMSEYQHNLLGVGVAPTEVEKLVPNLRNKNCYVLHYRNLQLYMSLGMRLTKVHHALWFDQSPWMEPYIRMNIELRKKAASSFEKDLYKLMNNSVFRKTMENLRRRVDVKLVWQSRALRHLRLPTWAPTTQHRQQKGVGENEGRVCRAPHRRIYRSALRCTQSLRPVGETSRR